MRERDRDIRRRRQRRKKAMKARIKELISQAHTKTKLVKKPAEILQEEMKGVQKPATRVVRPPKGAKKTGEAEKKSE